MTTVLTPGIASIFLKYVDLVLRDIWRQQHDTQHDYIFHSYRHDSYSQIGYIWVSSVIGTGIVASVVGCRIYSDHAPVIIIWRRGARVSNTFYGVWIVFY